MNGGLSQLYGGYFYSPLGQQASQQQARSQSLMNRYGFELGRLGGQYAGPIEQREALYRSQMADPILSRTAAPSLTRMGAATMAAGPMPLEKELQAPWYQRFQSFSFPNRSF